MAASAATLHAVFIVAYGGAQAASPTPLFRHFFSDGRNVLKSALLGNDVW